MSSNTNTIIASAAPVAALYTLNVKLLEQALNDIKDEHIHTRPNEHTNSIHWIYGHITSSRYNIAKILRINAEHNFEKLFIRAADLTASEDYPALPEVIDSFNNITEKIKDRFENITEEEFRAKSEYAFPGQEKTVQGSLTFLNFHETFHIGQIALIRKFLGYGRLVG